MARPLNQYAAIRRARIAVARRKILRVLRTEVVAHGRELERRVCEVGFSYYPLAPQVERPEPVHLTEARNALVRADEVTSIQRTIRGSEYNFYHLTDADPSEVAHALRAKVDATQAFDLIQHNQELCGFAAERYYYSAMTHADRLWVQPYRSGADIRALGALHSTRGVDLAALDKPTQVPIVVEVKNRREWSYPDHPAVWTLLGAAAELDAVPVLMPRRAGEPTYLFMADLGGYVAPAMNNWIDQAVYARPEAGAGGLTFDVAAITLGYRDVKVIDPAVPHPRFVRLFNERLADNLPAMHATFRTFRDEILYLARDEGLWDQDIRVGRISGTKRAQLVSQFWARVRLGQDRPPKHEEY